MCGTQGLNVFQDLAVDLDHFSKGFARSSSEAGVSGLCISSTGEAGEGVTELSACGT